MRYFLMFGFLLSLFMHREAGAKMSVATIAPAPVDQGTLESRRVIAERKNVLAWIAGLPAQGKIMSGQMSWSDTTIEAINTNYGKYPALRGFDWFAQSDPTLTTDIQQWSASNGMVHLMYHMPNPFASNAVYTNLTDGNWTNLVTESTTENTNWKVSLDLMADTIQSLQDDRIIVLFRPFHEMNGTWFWWGSQNATAAQFQAAWVYMHNYMTTTKGLKNIIWIYGPNSDTDSGSVVNQYPGNDYVDMVSLDIYGSNLSNPAPTYAADLAAVSGGKPFAVAEYGGCNPSGCSSGGVNISGNIPSNLPSGTTFWMNWESGAGNYFGLDQSNAGTATIFTDPSVLTLDEMPAF